MKFEQPPPENNDTSAEPNELSSNKETFFSQVRKKIRTGLIATLGLVPTQTTAYENHVGNEGSIFYKEPAAIRQYVEKNKVPVDYEAIFAQADVIVIGNYHRSEQQFEEITSRMKKFKELNTEIMAFEVHKEYQPILEEYMADKISFEECMRQIQILDKQREDNEYFTDEELSQQIEVLKKRDAKDFSKPFVMEFSVMKVAKENGLRVAAIDSETKNDKTIQKEDVLKHRFSQYGHRSSVMAEAIETEKRKLSPNGKLVVWVGSLHTGYHSERTIASINQYLTEKHISSIAIDYVSPQVGDELFYETPGFSGYPRNIVKDSKLYSEFVTLVPEGYTYSRLNKIMVEDLHQKEPVMIPVPQDDIERGSDVIIWLPSK